MSKLPTHDIFVTTNSGKEGETDFFHRIGGAWPHQDGKGYTIQLHALPVDGKLVMRKPLPKDEAQNSNERGNGYGQNPRGR